MNDHHSTAPLYALLHFEKQVNLKHDFRVELSAVFAKPREPSFLAARTIRPAYSAAIGLITSLYNIFLNSIAANYHAFSVVR